MASFAPVYRLPKSQSSLLTREQRRGHKRKRSGDADSDEVEEREPSEEFEREQTAPVKREAVEEEQPRVLYPVNKKDPYYVAGWSRETPLPGGNFPHAATKDTATAKLDIEEELAKLKPPIYVPKKQPDDPAGSVRGRHLDNMTAILHKCILNQDWDRATRVWGMMLRTEIAGHGPDIRKNGRWMIGAELLMRKGQTFEETVTDSGYDTSRTELPYEVAIPDRNFELVREYYSRLCLQYPQLVNSRPSTVAAGAIYPALFNVWIYEVQDRSKRARQKLADMSETSEAADAEAMQSERSDGSMHRRALLQIRYRELHEIAPIVRRLDELLVSPPHDTSAELLEIRGMISLWLVSLHRRLAVEVTAEALDDNEAEGLGIVESPLSRDQHQMQAHKEHVAATEAFRRVLSTGAQLSPENLAFLEVESRKLEDTGDD